jgi:serine/threonine-protein kinase
MPTEAGSGIQHCSDEVLQLALADALNDIEEQTAIRHLSECSHCQQRLELLAADRDTWIRLAANLNHSTRLLKDTVSGNLDPLLVKGQLDSAEDANAVSDDDSFDADFAVQFLSPSDDTESIGRLGDIEIREIIGRGAMGIVLRGWQGQLNRFVAVKVMSPYLAVSVTARRRFEREAQAAAAILHPNVMPIHSVSSTARLPWLVMPYLSCDSLQERIDREGVLPLIDQLQIAVQVARGLAAAHAHGLVHRDVKPANILLERGVDRVMLTDFGLARAVDDASLTRSGVIAGTPQYMSPEQARGDSIDQRSDLFSFGSVMYTMATGRAPFRAESSYGILRRLCETSARPIRDIHADAPEWLAILIERLHARNADDRIQTAAAAAEILEQCVAHVRQPASTPLPAACFRPISRPLQKSWRRLVGSGAALAAMVTAIFLWPQFKVPSVSQDGTTAGLPAAEAAPETPVAEQSSVRQPIWDDAVSSELEDIESRIRGLEEEHEAEQ